MGKSFFWKIGDMLGWWNTGSHSPETPIPQISTDLAELLTSTLVWKLTIEATNTTPAVSYDPKSCILSFSGKSIPERATDFWNPIKDTIKQLSPGWLTQIDFFLQYFNTSSSKHLKEIFEIPWFPAESITITWKYEEGDDDILEAWTDYQDIIQSDRTKYWHINPEFVFEEVVD